MLNRVEHQEARATVRRSVETERPDTPWPVGRPNEPRQAAYPNLRRGGLLPKKGYNHHRKVGNGVRQRQKALLSRLLQELVEENYEQIKAAVLMGLTGEKKDSHRYFKMALEQLEGKPLRRVRVDSPQPIYIVMGTENEKPDGDGGVVPGAERGLLGRENHAPRTKATAWDSDRDRR